MSLNFLYLAETGFNEKSLLLNYCFEEIAFEEFIRLTRNVIGYAVN